MAAAPGAVQPPQAASTSDDAPVLDVDRIGRPAVAVVASPVVVGVISSGVVGGTAPVGGRLERRPDYHCECGHRLSVSGVGRHRVYFEIGQKGTDQPIMDRACPACARGLPGKNPR